MEINEIIKQAMEALAKKQYNIVKKRLEDLGLQHVLTDVTKRHFQKLIKYADENGNQYYYADDGTFNGVFVVAFLRKEPNYEINNLSYITHIEYAFTYDENIVPNEIKNHAPGLAFE